VKDATDSQICRVENIATDAQIFEGREKIGRIARLGKPQMHRFAGRKYSHRCTDF